MGAPSIASDHGVGFHLATMPLSTPYNELDRDCDACPCCRDTCNEVDSCISCQKKLNAMHIQCRGPEASTQNRSWFMDALSSICQSSDIIDSKQSRTFTVCQLRRHNHANSAWILVGNTIYDATPYIRSHPGGMEAILKKSGGAVDCSEDLRFHSKRAQKEWRKFKVGTLCSCPCDHQ